MDKAIILRSFMLNADNISDIELQYRMIVGMINLIQKETVIDRDEFELLVEDIVGNRAVSMRKAQILLEHTGTFRFVDGQWIYNEELIIDGETINWEQLVNLFMQKDDISKVKESNNNLERDSILNGMHWSIEMTQLAISNGDIEGQPAFYSCNENGDMPIGYNVAGTATSDALTMLCQASDYLLDCGKSAMEISSCISFLLEKTMACQCRASGWDKGGFFPLEDQPESAHPTVDATCLAVMSLCTFYEQRSKIEENLEISLFVDNKCVEQAVLDGLDFLFRMQQPLGSYCIYRFEDGFESAANENCTRMVLSTMGVCKGSGIFDNTNRDDLYPVCSKVIDTTYDYLCSHMAEAGEYKVWAPYFGVRAQDYSVADVVVSTARVCRSFIPVWWQKEEERQNIIEYCKNFLQYWKENEEKIVGKVGRYRFNSPAEQGFSVGEYFWPSHPDMLAAFTILQTYNMFGMALTKEEWALIERAVKHTLDLQHSHGHWDNPLANKTPFCAVTLAAIELLQEYCKAKG